MQKIMKTYLSYAVTPWIFAAILTPALGPLRAAHSDETPPTGTTRVAPWKEDKKSAFSLQLDDSLPSDIENAVPELQKRGLTATFYLNPGMYHYKKNAAQWETELPKLPGVVYGNHTLMHDGLKDYASADADLKQVSATILKAFPGKEPRLISFAKPGVSKDKWTISDEDYQKVLRENHLVPREEAGLNAAQFNNLKTTEGMLAIVDDGIAKGAKRSILFHGIGGDWLSTPLDVFTPFLDGLVARQDQVWITDHISLHKYETERKSAKVNALENTDKKIQLELKSDADPQFYDEPLTLVTQIPATWKYAQVVQGTAKNVVAAANGLIQFDALPDGVAVVLTPSATGPTNPKPVPKPEPVAVQNPPIVATGSSVALSISGAEAIAGWDGVTLIDEAKVGAHAVRLAVPAGKAGGAAFNLRAANADFSKAGTIRFWYRLSGEGETDLMLKLVTPTFADNFQTVFPVFPAQKADGQWHQAVIDLAAPYQKWSAKPEAGNYLYFRTNAAANTSLTLDFDDLVFVPGDKKLATAAAPAPQIAKGPTLDPPDAARVKEIAAFLDANPHGLGFTINERGPWEALGATKNFREVMLPLAERFLNEPIPEVSEAAYDQAVQSGSRDINAPIDRRRFRLAHFVLSEGVENKGRFLPAIEKELAAICSEKSWIIAAHAKFTGKNDLGSAMTAWTVATAVSMLGDRLSEPTRTMVKDAVNQRVIQPFLVQMRDKTAPIDFWRNSPYNWNAVVHGGITGAALALDDSVGERAEIIAASEKETQFYIQGFPADGYSTEGMGYWKYGFGHYIMLSEAVLAATHGKVNLYDKGNSALVAQFPRRFEIAPAIYPAYSDSAFKDQPSNWLYYILDQRYGLGDQSPRSLSLDGTFSTFLYAYSINLAFESGKVGSNAKNNAIVQGHRLRDWFGESQVYVGRMPAGQQGIGLSFKGGNNGTSHGHNDQGSYVVVQGNTPLIVDAGSTVYNAATFGPQRYDNVIINSYGHDVPRVAGQLQGQGDKYFSKVANTNFSEAADNITLDLTKAYGVPELRKLSRTFDYTRANQGAVSVTDRVEFSSPQSFGTALITFGEAKEEKPGVWLISQNGQSVRATIDAGGVPFTVTNETLKDEAAAGKVRRLGVELDAPTMQATITVKVTP